MKYVLRGPYKETLIETILNNRGIENLEEFLNPSGKIKTDLTKIINIEEGMNLIINNLDKKFIVCVDSDVDGFSSASIIYQYLKEIKNDIDIDYYVHETKQHGLTNTFVNFVIFKEADIVIIPDAGSNDVEQIEYLESLGKKVLIIDHHEIERKTKNGIIINNQICEYTNKNFTGVGMSYLFAKAMNEKMRYNIDLTKYEDLLLIGSVGDGASIVEDELRYYCERARKNLNNNLIKRFYELKEIDLVTYTNISFGGIVPAINAIVRAGTLEEKKLVFKALNNIDTEYFEEVEKRKLNKETRKYEYVKFTYDLYESAIEACNKAKTRQDKIIKQKIKELMPQYNNEPIGIFKLTPDDEIKSITGVLANKIAGTIKVPTIIVWKDDNGNYIGSGRGNVKILSDFKEWCLNTNLFELAQGHANAFGIIFKEENLEKIKELATKVEKEEFCYEVDVVYDKEIKKQHFYIIDSYKEAWCSGCEEPLIAVKKLKVKKSNVSIRGSVLKIFDNGISYIKYKSDENEYKNIISKGFGDSVEFTMVGRYSINEYNGNKYPQVIVEDYEYEMINNYGLSGFFD